MATNESSAPAAVRPPHEPAPMQTAITFGRERLTVEIDPGRLLTLERAEAPPALADPVRAVRDALESPLRFPPLRHALTPDDHVTVVVDEHLPRLPEMVTAVLEHIVGAGVDLAAVTLLCPPPASKQPWIDDLPEALEDVHLEVHDPADRSRLAYLASTHDGRRVYLNRAAVDADQLVVLTGPRYDPLLGYGGAEGALYPAMSDAATRQSWDGDLTAAAPGKDAWPVRSEAGEVFWLLGAPFLVQVIEGEGDAVVQVLGGTADTAADGRRWLDQCWRATTSRPADIVIATISGDPARQDIGDMARALASAARVVRPDGIIVLLCAAAPELGPAFQAIQRADDPDDARKVLSADPPADWPAAYQWLGAVGKARVFLLSGLPAETAEALFATPLQHARQVQRLLDAGGTCLVLPDAHKLLAVVTD
jgi:nickel-dependent lactate racemase